jgi:hypothetical protein
MADIRAFLSASDEFLKPDRKEHRHFFNGVNYLVSQAEVAALLYSIPGPLTQKPSICTHGGKQRHQAEYTPAFRMNPSHSGHP